LYSGKKPAICLSLHCARTRFSCRARVKTAYHFWRSESVSPAASNERGETTGSGCASVDMVAMKFSAPMFLKLFLNADCGDKFAALTRTQRQYLSGDESVRCFRESVRHSSLSRVTIS